MSNKKPAIVNKRQPRLRKVKQKRAYVRTELECLTILEDGKGHWTSIHAAFVTNNKEFKIRRARGQKSGTRKMIHYGELVTVSFEANLVIYS